MIGGLLDVCGGGLLNLYSSSAWISCRVFELGMRFSLNIDAGAQTTRCIDLTSSPVAYFPNNRV